MGCSTADQIDDLLLKEIIFHKTSFILRSYDGKMFSDDLHVFPFFVFPVKGSPK
jgi:hypothetical protein